MTFLKKRKGILDEAVLDEAVERILNVVFAGEEHHPEVISDKETDHKKAADIETECVVLLENNGILPLNTDRKVAYIGEFAEKPRYQGGVQIILARELPVDEQELADSVEKMIEREGGYEF